MAAAFFVATTLWAAASGPANGVELARAADLALLQQREREGGAGVEQPVQRLRALDHADAVERHLPQLLRRAAPRGRDERGAEGDAGAEARRLHHLSS